MANEASRHTLQPTALVHEAWLHLGGDSQLEAVAVGMIEGAQVSQSLQAGDPAYGLNLVE